MSHPLDALEWPVHTRRLLLRRATAEDVDATWAFRRLPEVHDWLGAATATYDAYRERYFRGQQLSNLLMVELDGRVIGDLMLKVQDGWARRLHRNGQASTRTRGPQAAFWAGGAWLCRTCLPSGLRASVVPSGWRISCQPRRWMQTSWWNCIPG